MKTALLILLVSFFCIEAQAQVIQNPVQKMQLKFQSAKGTNATSVAYNAYANVYYSCIAGNADFPLEVFSGDNGSTLKSMSAGIDLRGLWWNDANHRIEVTTHPDIAIAYYNVKGTGLPENEGAMTETTLQHDDNNAVPAFYPKKKQLIYFNGTAFQFFSIKKGKKSAIVNLPPTIAADKMNSNVVIFTGVPNYELGVLNYQDKEIYLLNLKGQLTSTIKLPDNAVTHEMFRFSFANKMAWLYDADARTWTGYQIFD